MQFWVACLALKVDYYSWIFKHAFRRVRGQTIGKMILSIKVGNQDGSTADIGKMMGRACLKRSMAYVHY